MTIRSESMPCLADVVARWDAEARKVRYYASFEGADESDHWVEVPAEDFTRLTHLFTREAIEAACHQIYETLEHVKVVLTDFASFREGLEKFSEATRSPAEGTDN